MKVVGASSINKEKLEEEITKAIEGDSGLEYIYFIVSELVRVSVSQILQAFKIIADSKGLSITEEEINDAMSKARTKLMQDIANQIK